MPRKYFYRTIELANVTGIAAARFAEQFPNVDGVATYYGRDRLIGYDPLGVGPLPVQRVVDYSASPSLHKCDGRCLGAIMPTTRHPDIRPLAMKCQCACGGRNHGRGKITD